MPSLGRAVYYGVFLVLNKTTCFENIVKLTFGEYSWCHQTLVYFVPRIVSLGSEDKYALPQLKKMGNRIFNAFFKKGSGGMPPSMMTILNSVLYHMGSGG